MTVDQQFVLRRYAPPPALSGFLVLLALLFAVAYAAGTAAGPVAPGMHRAVPGGVTGTGSGGAGQLHGGGH
jgi:hypothetical protein